MTETPKDRFYFRPNIDVYTDKKAVHLLAGDIAEWIIKQRDRVQAEIAKENEPL